MKTKITAIATLIIVAGIITWQVGVLNISKNLASVVQISNISELPVCKSDTQIKALTDVVEDAQKKIKSLATEARVAKNALSAAQAKVTAQDKVVASKLAVQDTAQKNLVLKKKTYESLLDKATTTSKTNAYKAYISAEKTYTDANTQYTNALKTRDSLEAVRLSAQGNYARFVVPAGKSMSPEAELRNALFTDAKNILNSALALPKCAASENTTTQCSNNIDDDRDGKADCQDAECSALAMCRGTSGGGSTTTVSNTNTNNRPAVTGCSDPRYFDKNSCLIATIYEEANCSNGSLDQTSCVNSGGTWNPGREVPANNTWTPDRSSNSNNTGAGDVCEMGDKKKPSWFKFNVDIFGFKSFGTLVCGDTQGSCLNGYSLDGEVKVVQVYGGGYNVSWTCSKMNPYNSKCDLSEKCNISVSSTHNTNGGNNKE